MNKCAMSSELPLRGPRAITALYVLVGKGRGDLPSMFQVATDRFLLQIGSPSSAEEVERRIETIEPTMIRLAKLFIETEERMNAILSAQSNQVLAEHAEHFAKGTQMLKDYVTSYDDYMSKKADA